MLLSTFLIYWTICGAIGLAVYHLFSYYRTMQNKDEYSITLNHIICAPIAIILGPIMILFDLIHILVESGDKIVLRIPFRRRKDE